MLMLNFFCHGQLFSPVDTILSSFRSTYASKHSPSICLTQVYQCLFKALCWQKLVFYLALIWYRLKLWDRVSFFCPKPYFWQYYQRFEYSLTLNCSSLPQMTWCCTKHSHLCHCEWRLVNDSVCCAFFRWTQVSWNDQKLHQRHYLPDLPRLTW